MGPFHAGVVYHICKLIECPEIILLPKYCSAVSTSVTLSAFSSWKRLDTMHATHAMHAEGELPHLKEISIAFLESALERPGKDFLLSLLRVVK